MITEPIELSSSSAHKLTVYQGDKRTVLMVANKANLRRSLLAAGISPYTKITNDLNCGGRGLCATCGVWIEEGEPKPKQWHDWLAQKFRYPRLSCQIEVVQHMQIWILTDKIIWGKRRPSKN